MYFTVIKLSSKKSLHFSQCCIARSKKGNKCETDRMTFSCRTKLLGVVVISDVQQMNKFTHHIDRRIDSVHYNIERNIQHNATTSQPNCAKLVGFS